MVVIICKECGEEREHHAKGLCKKCYGREHYAKNREYYCKYRVENRERHIEYRRKNYAKNREYSWKSDLKAKYGITSAEYDKILKEQNNQCAICNKTPEENGRKLSVDHDHKTKKIRGLLCDTCNFALGLFQDNPQLLTRATEYLKRKGGTEKH